MQSHLILPSIFSFSFFLLVFHVPTSSSQVDDRYDQCAPIDFLCGGINYTIEYPFWVGGRSDLCSFSGYSFICLDNSFVIQMPPVTYVVKKIDYDNNILTIVDKDFVDQTCPISTNTTIEYGYFNPTDQVRNLTLYYNCTTSIEPARFHRVPCLTGATKYSYFTVQTEIDMPVTFADCDMSVISILETYVDRLENDPQLFGNVLQAGFDVTWTVGAMWCKQCVSSGGRCGNRESFNQEPTCYCKDGPYLTKCPGDGGIKKRKIVKIVIGVSAAAGVIFLICLFFFLSRVISPGTSGQKFWLDNPIFIWKKRTKDAHNVEEFLKNYGSHNLQRYRYSEIKKITNSFKDKLGQGGYGGVFKGKLLDGRLVAVKVLNETKGNGEEFINEVASIGRTYHVNIVMLLGFCSEGSKRALIYDFMPNGSLEKFIYAEKPRTTNHTLGWENLYQIAVGIARGLEYLHRGCSTRILHFDIKPHNILLDQDFCPKISDFGLAKLCPTKDSIISMLGARGTVGYIAPEVFCRNFGGVSYKSDVYSYGMMVLEMVGGRRNIDAGVENTSEIYFPQWIYERLDLNKDLLLHGIATQVEEETARKMIIVGLWCIQTHPTNRPTISRVVEMLEGSLESLPMPPDPILSSPSRPESQSSTTTCASKMVT